MKASNAAGVPPAGNVPIVSKRGRISALRTMAVTSSAMRCTMASGVPAGASMPAQVLPAKPEKPCSMKVGTSGTAGSRCSPATPISRILPSLPAGIRPVGASKSSWICPPSRSARAGAAPR